MLDSGDPKRAEQRETALAKIKTDATNAKTRESAAKVLDKLEQDRERERRKANAALPQRRPELDDELQGDAILRFGNKPAPTVQ